MKDKPIKLAFGFVAFLYIAWILAWLLDKALIPHWAFLGTHFGNAMYWLVMKIAIWLLPAVYVLRLSGRNIGEMVGIRKSKQILVWGGVAGLFLALLSIATKLYFHTTPLFVNEWSWTILSAVIVAPITEEFAFRGLVLGNLLTKYKFFWANTIIAFLFLCAHFPGWYFQGRLVTMLMSFVGGALSVFLIGWLFGYVYYRSKSTAASTLTHAINNLFSI